MRLAKLWLKRNYLWWEAWLTNNSMLELIFTFFQSSTAWHNPSNGFITSHHQLNRVAKLDTSHVRRRNLLRRVGQRISLEKKTILLEFCCPDAQFCLCWTENWLLWDLSGLSPLTGDRPLWWTSSSPPSRTVANQINSTLPTRGKIKRTF